MRNTHFHLRALILLAAGLLPWMAHAQSGIRATALHYENQGKGSSLNFTMAFDHAVTDRTFIGFEFIKSFRVGEPKERSNNLSDYTVSYNQSISAIGFQFNSGFFLSGEDEGLYLSSFLGYRKLAQTTTLLGYFSSNNANWGQPDPVWAQRRSSTMEGGVFPVGLRLGYRSEMDGYYGDVYFGIGTQLGRNGGSGKLPIYVPVGDGFAGFTIQAGYTLGLGW